MATKKAGKEQGKGAGRGSHPNSRANLEKGRWKAGESGNPAGKREGTPDRASVFRPLLTLSVEVADPEKKGEAKKVTLYEAMALGQIKAAVNGNTRAWQEIQDSLFGKMPQKVEVKDARAAALEQVREWRESQPDIPVQTLIEWAAEDFGIDKAELSSSEAVN